LVGLPFFAFSCFTTFLLLDPGDMLALFELASDEESSESSSEVAVLELPAAFQ